MLGIFNVRIGELNLPQRRAGPTLYQLSYIPVGTDHRLSGFCTYHLLLLLSLSLLSSSLLLLLYSLVMHAV